MIDIVHDGNIIFVACDIVFEVDSGNFAKFILRAVVRFLVPISMVFLHLSPDFNKIWHFNRLSAQCHSTS